MKIKNGDIVARHSYKYDMIFRVVHIQGQQAELAGEDMRLLADAPKSFTL